MKMLQKLGISLLALLALAGLASAQKWQALKHPANFHAGAIALLYRWYGIDPRGTGSEPAELV